MEQLLQQIENIKKEIAAATGTTTAEVEAFRIKFLGTKGLVKQIMGEMKNVPNEQKKEFGQILNAFKIAAEEKLEILLRSPKKVNLTWQLLVSTFLIMMLCKSQKISKNRKEVN